MSDENRLPAEPHPSTGPFDRRMFLKILGAAFSTAMLPAVTACSNSDEHSVLEEVENLTARETLAVVRPEDMLVLSLGLVNLRRSPSGTLVKLAPAAAAYVIVTFPPQAILEDAATLTDAGVPASFFANAWLGGASRLVFQLPTNYGSPTDAPAIAFALDAILRLLATCNIVVTDAMKTSIAATTAVPNAATALPPNVPQLPRLLETRSAQLSAESDPAASARKMALDGTLAAIAPLQQPYAGVTTGLPQGLSDGSVSMIEIPYRLQISPNNLAGWSHASRPVQGTTPAGAPGACEVWHTVLGARTALPGIAAKADERNAYLRTVRAVWTRDLDLGQCASVTASAKVACNNEPTVAWNPAPSPGRNIQVQNPSLKASERLRIVQLSSQAPAAQPIQVNRLMLSALGGTFDAHAELNDPDHVVDSWTHRMSGGRESYVQVVSTGVVLPFGNVATKIHVTKRNEDPNLGPVGALYGFDIIVIRNCVASFRAPDFRTAAAQNTLLQWPFTTIELKQKQFVTQTTSASDYWAVDLSGTPIMVPVVGYDQRGRAIHFSVPLYFVGPQALPISDGPVTSYRNALRAPPYAAPRTTTVPSVGIADPKAPGGPATCLNVAMGGQRIAYAYSKRDDTTYATRQLYVDLSPAAGEAFPYLPIVTGAQLDVEALHSYTDGQPVTAWYHSSYAAHGLDPAANRSQLLFRLSAPVSADFRNRPDGGTGFIAPNMNFQALSRTTGPAHDFTTQGQLAVHALRAMDSPASLGDGGFNPSAYLGLLTKDLEKLKLFGVFSLLDIIKAVDPDEASKDLAGLAQSAEQAALKYAPKFVAEGLSEVEKIISTIVAIKSQVETIWANATELLGSDYVQAVANNPGQVVSTAVSGALATAQGIADDQKQIVVQKLTDIVTKAKAFYTTLQTAVANIESFDILALAGAVNPPPTPNGSLLQLVRDGVAVKDAILDLANYGARAALKAKDAIVAAQSTIASAASSRRLALASGPIPDPTNQVTNTALQIAQGIQEAFGKRLDELQTILGDLSNLDAVKTRFLQIFDDAKKAINALRDMTIKIEWQPKIGAYYLPGTDWMVFRPATAHSLTLALEARTKAQDGKSAGVDVSCRLDHFDICVGSDPVIAVQFDHISFAMEAGKKPDVDVKINGIVFGGPLKFIETLRKIIPLDGFSDPPYLNVDAHGIHAGFSLQVPNVAIGIFSVENIAISAKLEIPFLADGGPVSALTFSFSFCDKDHPFLITFSLLGGGGYFFFSLTPAGLETLEASISVGAMLSINLLDIAQGSISILVGITFTIKDVKNANGDSVGKDVSLTAFLRIHGELDILGIISISVDVSVSITYDFTTNTMIAEAQIKVDVSILFFSLHTTLPFRKEFHSCNNDPTLAELMPPDPTTNVPSAFWADYCHAYS